MSELTISPEGAIVYGPTSGGFLRIDAKTNLTDPVSEFEKVIARASRESGLPESEVVGQLMFNGSFKWVEPSKI